ncbi:MAG: SRPBCC family protein [Nitrosotalea sp.]
MIKIEIKTQIAASQEKVWNIISKIDDDSQYWKGITGIRNISKNRNVTAREISRVNGSKCYQKVTLFPREGIHIRYTNGPMVGIKDILLTSIGDVTILEIQMDYRLSGVVRLVPKSILKELQFEAELALQLIKEEAEEAPCSPLMGDRKLWVDLVNGK